MLTMGRLISLLYVLINIFTGKLFLCYICVYDYVTIFFTLNVRVVNHQ